MSDKDSENCTCEADKKCCGRRGKMRGGRMASPIFGLGFLGALVYYIHNANNFGQGVLGVLKALVWPAMLVYHLLGHLNM